VGITIIPVKMEIVEKPPRSSCGGGQGLSWAVEPMKDEERRTEIYLPYKNTDDWLDVTFMFVFS
jgi:hypothetical protein